ncbi:DUF4179 domain-containing protein [Clostridium sp.]|uniref:DUF4179 domain-containing protein n=1 Tax=Clostridium sp. TaxID=1506 RepID=UPI0025BDBB30|nr:DUF4179 domain-containing protein [Clostridium sp.]
MKDINIDDIKVSSKLDDIIKNSVNEGYDTTCSKNLSNSKPKKFNKNIVAATIFIALGVTVFGSIFSNEVIAAVKLTMFDIKNYLRVNDNLDEYSTVVNKSVSKNGITVQLNEVILDKDEIIVSTTVKSDQKLGDNGNIMVFGNVYINGKQISSSAGGLGKQIDDYTEENVLSYTLDKELERGDLHIEIKYDEALLHMDKKEVKVEGPWNFEFISNGDALSTNTNSINLNNSFTLDNGQKITLNEYKSNVVGGKIYYSIENKDRNNIYSLELRGYDDLGNEVKFYSSYEEMTTGLLKNQTEISQDAKVLRLTPYAVAYPKESGRMSNNYKQVGEAFTIKLK